MKHKSCNVTLHDIINVGEWIVFLITHWLSTLLCLDHIVIGLAGPNILLSVVKAGSFFPLQELQALLVSTLLTCYMTCTSTL